MKSYNKIQDAIRQYRTNYILIINRIIMLNKGIKNLELFA